MEQKKITLPKGWEIDKVEGNEIILKESKEELPKTWFECLCKFKGDLEYIDSSSNIISHDLDGFFPSDENLLPKGLGKPMLALCKLLICRDVYRQGWKPNWNDNSEKYSIKNFNNDLDKEGILRSARILSFQSKEIRDKFLENFQDLIEEAKELI